MDDAVLTEATAATYVGAAAFRVGPPGRVGVELEYPVRDPARPLDRPSIARLRAAVAHLGDPMPGGGRITVEPGGQLELASAVGATPQDCLDATAGDLALVRAALAADGLLLDGTGLDTARAPRLVTEHPRYVALAAYHDRVGPKGREIMCNSASVQVCLDAGDDSDGWTGYRRRWWLADALGPVLLASFANSPHRGRSGVRWVSRRQALRFGTDASRTRAPRYAADPRTAWTRYTLSAQVAMIAEPEPLPWLVPTGLTMRDWLRGHGPRPATLGDLERHLGTLVPPVRPRGYLEFRMIDQQPDDGWVVPVAVVSALLDDPVAAEAAAAATEHLRSPLRRHRDWLTSARDGLADPALAAAALTCFTAAADALSRRGASMEVRRAVTDFIDRYVARGRCPADDPRAQASALLPS
ncbi:glutamate-cysteine ligase family protein [Micromonospora yasonensis]|uniref:glutamate-cysteine ligase family protein n=1 Tax=Micromonospora yasonensis TaxID=1128667 RepID=UPI0022324EFC|nr:glutamate-cysteine ligase family protein [Micromonospora yasonensis]MCW3842552.1 glutamate-cysteine ligase family protein [Micromonospora yasonensis]